MRKIIITIVITIIFIFTMRSIVYAEALPLKDVLKMAKEVDEDNAYLLTAIAERESSFRPTVTNDECIGLCQVIPRYWQKEIDKLEISDLFDPEQNLALANEILKSTDYPIELKLMLYSMKRNRAFELWEQGKISSYALGVLKRAEDLQREDFIEQVNATAIESTTKEIIVMSSESYEICRPLDIRVLIDDELKLYEWQHFKEVQNGN